MEYPPQLLQKILKFRKIDDNTGCWLWTAGVDKDGYGIVRFQVKRYRIHRVFIGAESYDQVNHKRTCPNKNCFNPDHVYIGTSSENRIDFYRTGGENSNTKKTICINGHLFDRMNKRNGKRYCSICMKKYKDNFNLRNARKITP